MKRGQKKAVVQWYQGIIADSIRAQIKGEDPYSPYTDAALAARLRDCAGIPASAGMVTLLRRALGIPDSRGRRMIHNGNNKQGLERMVSAGEQQCFSGAVAASQQAAKAGE